MCIPGYWISGFHGFHHPRKLQYPMGWGTLGFAFPAALGASLAGTGPTVSISGDGGFLYACGELATMAQERLPFTAVIVDDGGYGMLRYDQQLAGEASYGVDLADAGLRRAGGELRPAGGDRRGPRRRVRRGARAPRRGPGPERARSEGGGARAAADDVAELVSQAACAAAGALLSPREPRARLRSTPTTRSPIRERRSRRRIPTASPRSCGCSGDGPRAVERCRVLELGCGDGGNVIPMAYALPEAEFVGLDLNAAAVARGRRDRRGAGTRQRAARRLGHRGARRTGARAFRPRHRARRLLVGSRARACGAARALPCVPGARRQRVRELQRAAGRPRAADAPRRPPLAGARHRGPVRADRGGARPAATAAGARAVRRRPRARAAADARGRRQPHLPRRARRDERPAVDHRVREPCRRRAGLAYLCDAELHDGIHGAPGRAGRRTRRPHRPRAAVGRADLADVPPGDPRPRRRAHDRRAPGGRARGRCTSAATSARRATCA